MSSPYSQSNGNPSRHSYPCRSLAGAAALLLGLTAGAASAQDGGWDYRASLYGWVPSLDADLETPLGPLSSNSSGGDVLDNLDMAFMGTFEARRDRWSFLGDFIYTDLSTSKDTPFGRAFSQGDIKLKMTAISGYALYRTYETEKFQIDAGLGLRNFGADLDIDLESERAGRSRSFGGDKNWTLPLVALRMIAPIDDKWFMTGLIDYGQTSGDVTTWQGLALVGYQFNPTWAVHVGWRHMELEQEIGDTDADLALDGPIIGVSARF